MIMIFLAQVKKSNECGSVSNNEIFNVNFDYFFFLNMFSSKAVKIYHIITIHITYYAIQWVTIDSYSSRFIMYALSFILSNFFFFFLSKQHQIFLYFSKLLKGWVGIKNPDQLCFFLVPDSIAPLLPQITPLPGYIFPV